VLLTATRWVDVDVEVEGATRTAPPLLVARAEAGVALACAPPDER